MLVGGFGAGAKAVSSAGAGLDLWDLDGGAVTARLDEAVTNQQYPNGNVAPIGALAVTPDGGSVIWASGRYWDSGTRTLGVHRRLDSGHPRPITCLAIAGDRQEVISGSRELEAAQEHRNPPANALRVWNIATAKLVRSLQGHPCGVNDLAVSADGEYVGSAPNPGLYAFQDTAPRVWSLSTGEMLFAFDGHSFTVSAVAFTPDGRLLLSGGGNCFQRYSPESTVKVWDFAGRTLAHNLDRHQGPVVAKNPCHS